MLMKTFGSHTGARRSIRFKKYTNGYFHVNCHRNIQNETNNKKLPTAVPVPPRPFSSQDHGWPPPKCAKKIMLDTGSLRIWGKDFHGDKERYSLSRSGNMHSKLLEEVKLIIMYFPSSSRTQRSLMKGKQVLPEKKEN